MVTAVVAGKHICLEVARFRDLVAAGVIKRMPSGGYKLDAVRESYIRHMQKVAAGRAADGGESLAKQRARLAKAQAETAERKNDFEAGKLVEVTLAVDLLEQLIVPMRENLLNLPGVCADSLTPHTPMDRGLIADILRRKVYDALSYLALPTSYPPFAGYLNEDRKAASEKQQDDDTA